VAFNHALQTYQSAEIRRDDVMVLGFSLVPEPLSLARQKSEPKLVCQH